MATQIIHRLVDDLDGGKADESVRFALDGVLYEIDLSSPNARKLRLALAPYIDAGQMVKRPAKFGHTYQGGTTAGTSNAQEKHERTLIRAWARKQERFKGIGDRGKIAQEIVDAYRNRSNGTMTVREVTLPEADDVATGTGAAVATAVKAAQPAAKKATAAKAAPARKAATAKAPEAGPRGKVSGRPAKTAKAPARKAPAKR